MSDQAEDQDLAELSAKLSPLRYQRVPGRWEQLAAETSPRRTGLKLAIAVAAVLAVGAFAMFGRPPSLPVVVTRDGGSSNTRLSLSRWLETGPGEVATVTMADVGSVRVEPGSRVRLKATGATQQRLELERGEMSASVSAPPRLFVVDTPHATAVDLGCAYTLAVVDSEHTMLTVEEGEVSLEGEHGASRVLAGMRAISRRGRTPGTPFALDAPEPLLAALRTFDDTADAAAVEQALVVARREDAPTLWHLLNRVDGAQRDAVAQRLASFVPPPKDLTEAGAMQAWWGAIREAHLAK